jgi:putative flippase GtrA
MVRSTLRRRVPEFGRFLLVGAVGFVVDGCLLVLLVDAFGASPLPARIPSFLVAVTVTWWLHRRFTFPEARANHPTLGEWLRFVGANALGNGLNLGIYGFLVGLGGWRAVPALAVASGIAAAINYGASAGWVFRRR